MLGELSSITDFLFKTLKKSLKAPHDPAECTSNLEKQPCPGLHPQNVREGILPL